MLKKYMICLATFSVAGLFSVVGQSTEAEDADFEAFLQQHSAEFEQYAQTQLAEFDNFVARWHEAEEAYRAELREHWNDVELSSQTRYVEYSADKQQRTVVDYETNQVIIEIKRPQAEPKPELEPETQPELEPELEQESERASEVAPEYLQQAAQQLKRLSNTRVADAVEQDPVRRKAGLDVAPMPLPSTSTSASEATLLSVEEAILNEEGLEVTESADVITIRLQLPTDLSSRRANNALPQVKQQAERWQLPPALVLAIMHTESSFNPMARSPIPAFGLMQIVPQSAGRDVTEFLTGQQQLLSPDYLYNPEQNIEAGSVYLHMLYNRYFNGVTDSQSRWYLAIAAYNTGPGNVARALTGTTILSTARERANQMSADMLYEFLINNLAANETRLYLQKVTEREAFYQQQLGITI